MTHQTATSIFNDTYNDKSKKVLIFITAKCNNISEINDIFQETFMEFYNALIKYNVGHIKNYEAFIMKIAKQKIYRYYSLLDKIKKTTAISNDDDTYANTLESDEISVEDNIITRELLDEIEKEISEKSQLIQKIFYLYYHLDLPILEISSQLEISEQTVKNKLYRTINEIRKLYLKKENL